MPLALRWNSSDVFAHGLNERVEVRALFGALEFWKAIIDHLAGRPMP